MAEFVCVCVPGGAAGAGCRLSLLPNLISHLLDIVGLRVWVCVCCARRKAMIDTFWPVRFVQNQQTNNSRSTKNVYKIYTYRNERAVELTFELNGILVDQNGRGMHETHEDGNDKQCSCQIDPNGCALLCVKRQNKCENCTCHTLAHTFGQTQSTQPPFDARQKLIYHSHDMQDAAAVSIHIVGIFRLIVLGVLRASMN